MCGQHRTNVFVSQLLNYKHFSCISVFNPIFLFKGEDKYTGYFSKLLVKPLKILGLVTVWLGILLSCAYLKDLKIVTHINLFH
jgi:hypothetical protein